MLICLRGTILPTLTSHRDPIYNERQCREFAEALVAKRLAYSSRPGPHLEELLGQSELLDSEPDRGGDDRFMELLARHGTPAILARAQRQRTETPKRFRTGMVRKLRGTLLLREAALHSRGHSQVDVYSGLKMVLRCTDSTPRRMVRMFSRIVDAGDLTERRPISRSIQSRIVTELSQETLRRIASEPKVGPGLYGLVRQMGEYMRSELHDSLLGGTDAVASVFVSDMLSPEKKELVARAVDLALLVPNKADMVPISFVTSPSLHLAYALAPAFMLLPRKGKGRALSGMISDVNVGQMTLGREPRSSWES